MALHAADPRPGFLETIQDRLARLVGRPEFRRRRLSQVDPLDVHLVALHDVYTVRVPDIVEGGLVARALWVAQRYLVFDRDEPISSVELADPDGTGFMVTEGPYVAATARSILLAEQSSLLPEARIRVLRIPPLYVMALWLHRDGDDGPVDVFLPMSPAPPPLEAQRPYTERELTQALQAIIAGIRDQPDYDEA